MRKETRSASAATAACTIRTYGFAIGESEHHKPRSIDDIDLADHQRNRRQH